MARIRTTHTGSLPRPHELEAMIVARDEGAATPGLGDAVEAAVGEAVRRQMSTGLDILNDGEQGKQGYATYVQDRLTGFEGESLGLGDLPELRDFPEYGPHLAALMQTLHVKTPACVGPVRLKDPDAVRRDIDRLLRAAESASVPRERLFLSAASPGVVAFFFADRHYGDREAYLGALAEAMRPEYEAIVSAGITLQLDCPDLAMARHLLFADRDLEEFRRAIALNVEALNEALKGLPAERLRMHVCWGNYEGPHHRDVGLADIIDVVLGARPNGLSVEASNPRHGHEWQVFEDVELPEGKYVIPGVVDSTSNFVEHPALVAQRLERYVSLLGAERVMAGSDCGFGTFVGLAQVAPSIAWAKLASMVEGAAMVGGPG
jgi:5-methyltetrahydropteroyltriglutamate--homocysteine methyltransferase